ncbi:MAG: hypothetical protein EBS06_08130 [Proteobacteria bacterium]|nr:hypothetical protein [Pseudomonadota bacterium]
MSEAQNSGGTKSFAERYAKKPSFTSQNLKKEEPKSNKPENGSIADSILNSSSKSNLKPIDPQKKMQAELIYLVKGIDAGRNAWYYVLVDRLKVQLFLKALNDEIIHLENYGKILFSAYGEEPPAEITNSLKEEYGIAS